MEIKTEITDSSSISTFDIVEPLEEGEIRKVSRKRKSQGQTDRKKRRKGPINRAVLIGINYIGTVNELRGCINDAKNIKDILISEYGFQEEDITLMTDEQTDSSLIPTKANIMTQIAKLTTGVRSGDSLVLTYSGHGAYVYDKNSDESDKRDETIIPLDYESSGHIVDDTLRKELVDKIPRGVKLFCIFDSCHSGTVLDLKYSMVPKSPSEFTLSRSSNYVASKGEVICISGCRDNQTSADTEEEGQAVGALSFGILHVLKEAQYSITYADFLEKLRDWMKANHYSQVPQLSFGKLVIIESFISFVR